MISFTNPVVIEPVAERVFPNAWVKYLEVSAPTSGGGATANVVLRPFNPTTGESAPDLEIQFSIDVFAAAEAYPQIGTAMAALFAAIEAYAKGENIIS